MTIEPFWTIDALKIRNLFSKSGKIYIPFSIPKVFHELILNVVLKSSFTANETADILWFFL